MNHESESFNNQSNWHHIDEAAAGFLTPPPAATAADSDEEVEPSPAVCATRLSHNTGTLGFISGGDLI